MQSYKFDSAGVNRERLREFVFPAGGKLLWDSGTVEVYVPDGIDAETVGEWIAQSAERDALARLEAWHGADPERRPYGIAREEGGVGLTVRLGRPHGVERVVALDCQRQSEGSLGKVPYMIYVGTPENPATLGECITAALDLWEKLYGEKEGATT